MLEFLKKHKYIIIISFVFAVLYCLVSLVNHYNFRTYALDLGLYSNAAYKYAHFSMADTGMIHNYHQLMLGGHFDLYLMLFSPLTYVFGTYTLLIVQIAALIFGGIGVYKYFLSYNTNNKLIPYLAAIFFYSFFGVFGALSFDYHSVVVASSLIPWFFISVRKDNKWISLLFLFLIIIAQENIALWMIFVCLGLAIEYRKEKKKMLMLFSFSALSVLYFIFILNVIIPIFSVEDKYTGFAYAALLGESMSEAFIHLITHPFESFKMLFTNHLGHEYYNGVKEETHIILLLSGLPLLIKKPQYLVMLLPIYFQKFYHDVFHVWSIFGQYNIEFAPILAIGIFSVISDIKKPILLNKVLAFLVVGLVVSATFRTMDNTVFFTDKARVRIYKAMHYQKDYNVKDLHKQLKDIPKDAVVSTQSAFIPQLAMRDKIYQFPKIDDANYIIYTFKESTYPISIEEFDVIINELLDSGEWMSEKSGELTILRKKRLIY